MLKEKLYAFQQNRIAIGRYKRGNVSIRKQLFNLIAFYEFDNIWTNIFGPLATIQKISLGVKDKENV